MLDFMKYLKKWSLMLAFSLAMLGGTAVYAAAPFDEGWLELLRQEAIQKGVTEKTAREVLRNLTPMDKFPKTTTEQAEFKETLAHYMQKRMPEDMIRQSAELLLQYEAELHEIEKTYGVPGQYIMAIWAIETRLGKNMGNENVIASLVTLARDHPNKDKREEFRQYLIDALKLVDKGYSEVLGNGSWAGAMGQPQFMPTSIMKFGVDLNRDGKVDIWNDKREIFASIANHLQRKRADAPWHTHERVHREVKVPRGLNPGLFTKLLKEKSQKSKTSREWGKLGLTQSDGTPLPDDDTMQAILIAPDGLPGPTFLAYNNFISIMGYNSAYLYALTVSKGADAIADRAAALRASANPVPRMN
ncbi:MAG TPA: lytic murein transglycosylase [Micavibrio sp.]